MRLRLSLGIQKNAYKGQVTQIPINRTLGCVLFLVASSVLLHAQSYRQFEIGMQSTIFRTQGETSGCSGCTVSEWMIGPEMVFNLDRHFALDGAVSLSPTSAHANDFSGGRMLQFAGGMKATLHGSRFSLFAKGRPGFVSWSKTVTDVTFLKLPPTSFEDIKISYGRRTSFALNMTGGIGYAFSTRLTATAELGDTLARTLISSFGSHLQLGTGLYYQFGKSEMIETTNRTSHTFFDRPNLGLITASLLAQTADAITTQRSIASCRRNSPFANDPIIGCSQYESDPIARPFVNHGWSGQIALAGIVNSAEILVMYGIHRMGHHKVERVPPAALAVASGVFAYKNLQTY